MTVPSPVFWHYRDASCRCVLTFAQTRQHDTLCHRTWYHVLKRPRIDISYLSFPFTLTSITYYPPTKSSSAHTTRFVYSGAPEGPTYSSLIRVKDLCTDVLGHHNIPSERGGPPPVGRLGDTTAITKGEYTVLSAYIHLFLTLLLVSLLIRAQ